MNSADPLIYSLSMKRGQANALLFVFSLAVVFSFALPGGEALAAEGCLRCHQGIERISDGPVMSGLSCRDCHLGDPGARSAAAAHQGMYANPSDYRVVDETCGPCHPEEAADSRKSLHSTAAGVISGARYAWGAQDTRNPIYAAYDVVDADGEVPSERGAVIFLERLPAYDHRKPVSSTNHPVDDLLRGRCLSCHLWSRGEGSPGRWRSSGCAACHVLYGEAGTYEGEDKAIPEGQEGRPRLHRITSSIPVSQCLTCHRDTGVSGTGYVGLMQAGGLGDESPVRLAPDVHYEKGMLCTDCHAGLHGDGNIYGRAAEAVEIECADCHGTAELYSTLFTSAGSPMESLGEKDGAVVMALEAGGQRRVPQTNDVIANGPAAARAAMGIKAHMEGMECYACHARWAPQCYGCHLEQDLGAASGDWINTKEPPDPSLSGSAGMRMDSAHLWRERLSYTRWENPVLGINSEGKVSPFVPGGQVVFTQRGADGKARIRDKVFTTHDGLPGFAHVPVQPHTVTREARQCEDCHSSPKALGLGAGLYNSAANGLPVPFEPESIVDSQGRQLQASARPGARPFNAREIESIQRTGVCLSCHEAQKEPYLWKKVSDVTGFAETDARHREILRKIFTEGTRRLETLREALPEPGPAGPAPAPEAE